MKGKLNLVLGGSRSGKSEFAERMAERSGKRVTYIATAAVFDEEMAVRVKLHRERRAKDWVTIEEETDVLGVLSTGDKGDVFLLDCATVWLTNLFFYQQRIAPDSALDITERRILEQVAGLAETIKRGLDLIVVSNEIGLGVVPAHHQGRILRDLAGKANQVLAAKADSVYLVVAGIPMEIKSGSQNS